jgi:hypothetical protein
MQILEVKMSKIEFYNKSIVQTVAGEGIRSSRSKNIYFGKPTIKTRIKDFWLKIRCSVFNGFRD